MQVKGTFGLLSGAAFGLSYAPRVLAESILKLGIASGPVYGRRMGSGPSSVFTIMGRPVNRAAHLCDLARREVHPMLAALVAATPQPFLQTIVDVVPARTVFGRVCLLGDAAFVVRPHTAGATAKAARDATTLARALKRAGRNVDAGLSGFEEMQIEFGRGLVDYGVALGRRWAA